MNGVVGHAADSTAGVRRRIADDARWSVLGSDSAAFTP